MKNRAVILLLLVILFSCNSQKNVLEKNTTSKTENKLKVIGYLPTYSFAKNNQIEYCKLTHLNLAFANPTPQGTLEINGNIRDIISKAKSVNPEIKICISLAGANMSKEQINSWHTYVDEQKNTPLFVQNIIKFTNEYQLNGVDIDLEWDNVTTGYSNFVINLKKELEKVNKILTVALPNNFRFENITSRALNSFDLINIMSYDRRGPWTPNDRGQHSSFENSKRGIEFWKKTQNISSQKLILGLPFYGYNFTYKKITSFPYSQIAELGEQYANQDNVGKIYYNGIATIKAKIDLAKNQKLGGVMIWELGQDSFTKLSLLKAIDEKIITLGLKSDSNCKK